MKVGVAMKEPHLIVLDLDDTLMTGFTSYDEETFEYLRHLKSLGHIIMIATGRPFRSSYFVYDALNLDTPLINYNGARVTNPKQARSQTYRGRRGRDQEGIAQDTRRLCPRDHTPLYRASRYRYR